ncbi:phage holin family protein [Caulobacter sp. 17J80-11]|uniref:phage holin family protein n=1 Tax=Caulobacter sp. 17J80-11 TaxID=2763502 RepID=UPI00351C53B9
MALGAFLLRLLVGAGGLWLASKVVPGVELHGAVDVLAAALLLGVVNALVRPLIVLLTLPVTLLTLGLFLLVVNAASIGLTAALLNGFEVHGFWAAIGAAVVTGAVSWAANVVSRKD